MSPPKIPLQIKKAPKGASLVPLKYRPLRSRLHVPPSNLEDQVLRERLPEQGVHDGLVLVVLPVDAVASQERDLLVIRYDRHGPRLDHLARHVVALWCSPADEGKDVGKGVSRCERILCRLVEVDREPPLLARRFLRSHHLCHVTLLLVEIL